MNTRPNWTTQTWLYSSKDPHWSCFSILHLPRSPIPYRKGDIAIATTIPTGLIGTCCNSFCSPPDLSIMYECAQGGLLPESDLHADPPADIPNLVCTSRKNGLIRKKWIRDLIGRYRHGYPAEKIRIGVVFQYFMCLVRRFGIEVAISRLQWRYQLGYWVLAATVFVHDLAWA